MIRRRRCLLAPASLALPWVARAEPGVGDQEVLIGQTGILTGLLGRQINVMLAGAELAFAEASNNGGIAGRRVRLRSLDDELKPDKAADNVRQLLDGPQPVLALFGCVGSATTAATLPLAKKAGAPMVGGYAVTDSVRARGDGTAYFLRATTGREAEALVQHLTTIGITRIAAAVLDNPGGQEALALIAGALAAHKLEPVASASFRGDAGNVAEGARKLVAARPQAVLMYLGGSLPGELMKATWAVGAQPSFYGMSIVAGEVTAKVAGPRARGLAISQVVPYPWARTDPLVARYRGLAEAANVPVGYYSFEGYLAAQVLLEALRRCGRDLTRERLHTALRGLRMRLAGMNVDFGAGHATGSRFVELVQVSHEGRFVR
jgi:ABC-type branched-subunit amino acid transport system substrate-binding protein